MFSYPRNMKKSSRSVFHSPYAQAEWYNFCSFLKKNSYDFESRKTLGIEQSESVLESLRFHFAEMRKPSLPSPVESEESKNSPANLDPSAVSSPRTTSVKRKASELELQKDQSADSVLSSRPKLALIGLNAVTRKMELSGLLFFASESHFPPFL